MKRAHSAVEFVKQMVKGDDDFQQMVEEETINLRVAQLVHDARVAAGLTQKQLAEMVGTGQSAIARLEDADYEGHSLSMLRRVAAALGMKVEIRFTVIEEERGPSRPLRG